jgi:hypothetical protein
MNKLDAQEELEKMLSEELVKNIDKEILNNLLKPIKLVNDFNSKLDELKAINRQLQIDSIIGDDSIILIKVEDTQEYKNLTDEYKQQYKGDYIHINFL